MNEWDWTIHCDMNCIFRSNCNFLCFVRNKSVSPIFSWNWIDVKSLVKSLVKWFMLDSSLLRTTAFSRSPYCEVWFMNFDLIIGRMCVSERNRRENSVSVISIKIWKFDGTKWLKNGFILLALLANMITFKWFVGTIRVGAH